VFEFENGATITIAASFDIAKHKHNHIELYGSEGSLVTPDPNTFTATLRCSARAMPTGGASRWATPMYKARPGALVCADSARPK
jgi:predicted dehydrogenase